MTTRRLLASQKPELEIVENCKVEDRNEFVQAPIDNFGVPGRWLRHKLLDGILVGAPVLTSIQRYRTPARTVLMKMISFLGTEDFYTVLFLAICWALDSRLGRLFGVLMGIGFYAAGFLKASLRLPRPEWPSIKPEEEAYDWALPSHHSLLGTILPWYIWIYVNLHVELTSLQLACLFVMIALWSFSVMFSRLYLGVHSPADIVSGGFVGVLILSLWLQLDDIVDNFISHQTIETVLQSTLFIAILLYLHPKCDPGNPSFTDNCCLAGVICGLIFARSQRSRLLGFLSLQETLPHETTLTKFAYLSAMRLLVGALAIFGARSILKFVIQNSVKMLYKLLNLPFYSSSAYKKAGLTAFKHYTNDFRLPPIYIKKSTDSDDSDDCASSDSSYSGPLIESKYFYSMSKTRQCESSMPKDIAYGANYWDIVVPTKCIVYAILTYFALEILPQVFIWLGI